MINRLFLLSCMGMLFLFFLNACAYAEETDDKKDVVFDVTDFGAVGEDDIDDTEAIQRAIDAASEEGGGTVFVPEGEYFIQAHVPGYEGNYLGDEGGIALESNVTLKLDQEAVLKAIPNEQEQYVIVRIFNKENVAVEGGKIQGERDEHSGDTGEWGYGIAITGGKDITVRDTILEDCWGDGMNIQVYRENDQVFLTENVTIENIESRNNRRQGMSIEGGESIIVRDSRFLDTNGTAPAAGVDIEPWNDAHEVTDVLFENCVFEGNEGAGLIVMGAGVSDVRIVDNVFQDNSEYEGGISLFFTSNIVVRRNLFIEDMMGIVTESENVTFTENSSTDGIGVINASNHILYERNVVSIEESWLPWEILVIPVYEENISQDIVLRENEIIGAIKDEEGEIIDIINAGIHATGVESLTVENNHIANLRFGLLLFEEISDIKITDNTFENIVSEIVYSDEDDFLYEDNIHRD